jgi:hypothetical protein
MFLGPLRGLLRVAPGGATRTAPKAPEFFSAISIFLSDLCA